MELRWLSKADKSTGASKVLCKLYDLTITSAVKFVFVTAERGTPKQLTDAKEHLIGKKNLTAA